MTTRPGSSGAEALFAAAFTYALTGILVREVAPMWGDKAQVAARFTIVLIFLSGYSFLRKNRVVIPKTKLYLTAVLGILFATMVLFFTVAIGKTTVANVLFVFYATNMITAFGLGTVLLKESVSSSKLLAMGLAITGLAVYSGAIVHGNLGILFSIIAGLCGGGTSLVSKQLSGIDRNGVLLVQYAIATVFIITLTLLSGDQIVRTASLRASLLTVLFALVIILGSYLTLYGFQHFDVNIGTVIMSTELILAAIMAYVLFHEVPKLHELIGGIFIFTGSVVGSGVFEKLPTDKQLAQPD